ncbi:hypothetical protein AVEN_214619-1 [Araneus ventricosus]|uniref:Uncharacterized protein n=1 Tax=Araneus ventricosus TaxID=182803 RepID=A0A4Y2GPB9_ARAVE|nr:hypothetical protein AVEN_214619-1 [Araneus ventricosus]
MPFVHDSLLLSGKEHLSDNRWCRCPKSLRLGVYLIGYGCAYKRFAASPLHSSAPYVRCISANFRVRIISLPTTATSVCEMKLQEGSGILRTCNAIYRV